jgi:alanyl aminopeptidase
MSTFLDQEGIPLVTADLLPDGKVKLTQKRFLSYGVAAPREQLWQIPVSLSYSDGSSVKTQHVLLTGREMTVTLEGTHAPAWIHPNAGPSGYYRWSVSSDMMSRLAESGAQAMTPVERVGYLGNLSALLEGGLTHGEEFTRLIGKFADDPTPEVILGLMDDVATVRRSFVTKDLADAYAAYVRKTFGPAMRRFGMSRREGEGEAVSLVRPALIRFLADDGQDPRAFSYADSLAKQHMASPGSVDPSLIATALEISAMKGDQALFEEYRKRFEQSEIPAERARFLGALGYFRDPKIADEAIHYSLSGPLRPQEMFTIPTAQSQSLEYEDAPYKWMSENFGTIASKIPPMFMVFMPVTASGCSMERVEKAKVFFADPAHQVPGTDKQLAKVVDQVTDCANLRQREGARVAAYLAQQVGMR